MGLLLMSREKRNKKPAVFVVVLFMAMIFCNHLTDNSGTRELSAKTNRNNTKLSEKIKTNAEKTVRDNTALPTRLSYVEQESEISKGVYYKKYVFRTGSSKHIAHVIEADISNPDFKVEILKAKNNTSEVQKLTDMIDNYDTTNNHLMLGAVNASYWRSYTNHPMGPTIINGEVAELYSFKTWTSAFFDEDGKMHLDRFHTNCIVKDKSGKEYEIKLVNRRNDSLGVVLYNNYVGDRVPYISNISVKTAYDKAMKDEEFRDISEEEFDKAKFLRELRVKQRLGSYDFRAPKIIMKYLDSPAMNKEIQCVVTAYNRRGTVPVPQDGCVLTFGLNIDRSKLPSIGDTLSLKYSTDVMDTTVFMNALCGTPRLVRDGRARAEIQEENLKSKRFIEGALKRTAIGTSKEKDIVYFVAVESSNSKKGVLGANLKQMAYMMRKIGAYDALNLDGGGSTVMVVNDQNVMHPNRKAYSRSLAVGIGVARKKISLKSIFDKFN